MKISKGTSATEKTVNGDDASLTQQLVEVTDAVRKKFNSIKNNRMENMMALEKVYEPVTKPLKEISAATAVKVPQPSSSSSSPIQVKQYTKSRKRSSSSIESTPITSRHKDSSDQDDDGDENKKTRQISFVETPPSSTFITSPDSDTTLSEKEQLNNVVMKHIHQLSYGDSKYDTVYGVRIHPITGKLQMGNAELRFPSDNIEVWANKKKLATYKATSTLYGAIFLKLPPILYSGEDIVNNEDIQIYKKILEITNAPYKRYDVRNGLNPNKTRKYREIIEPLLSYKMVTRSHSSGEGLLLPKIPSMKLFNSKGVDYVYWNKPKELINRLRLLWSSKMAGHSGHDNEILNIIEELREEGIVY